MKRILKQLTFKKYLRYCVLKKFYMIHNILKMFSKYYLIIQTKHFLHMIITLFYFPKTSRKHIFIVLCCLKHTIYILLELYTLVIINNFIFNFKKVLVVFWDFSSAIFLYLSNCIIIIQI